MKSVPVGSWMRSLSFVVVRTLVILIKLFRIFWSPKAMAKQEAGTGTIFSKFKINPEGLCQIITSCCEINVRGVITGSKLLTTTYMEKNLSQARTFFEGLRPAWKHLNFPTVPLPQGPTKGTTVNKQEDAGCKAWNHGPEIQRRSVAGKILFYQQHLQRLV